MNAPCKNCKKKGCGDYHSQCELYLEWKKEYSKGMKRIPYSGYKEAKVRDHFKRKYFRKEN